MHVMNFSRARGVKGQSGFSIIEVLVALIILAIGLLGVAGVQALSLKQTANSNIRSQITMYAYDLSERMRAEPGHFNDYEKAAAATCEKCADDLASWHNAVVNDISTATTAVDVTSNANLTTAEITINWSERDLYNDAAAQSYTLFVRLR